MCKHFALKLKDKVFIHLSGGYRGEAEGGVACQLSQTVGQTDGHRFILYMYIMKAKSSLNM